MNIPHEDVIAMPDVQVDQLLEVMDQEIAADEDRKEAAALRLFQKIQG